MFEVMRAKTYRPDRIEVWDRITVEPKLDGVRVVALVRPGEEPKFYSRNGRELMMFGHLCVVVAHLGSRLFREDRAFRDGVMLDGEMMDSTFGEIAGAIHRKNTTVKSAWFHIFHAMPLPNFRKGLDTEPQWTRRVQLTNAALTLDDASGLAITVAANVTSHDHVMVLNAKFRRQDFEGSMVKDLSRPWEAKRSYAWMKIKDELSVDVRVTGMREGRGKYVGMCGALVVSHRGKEVRVAGMDDELRSTFWQKPKKIIGHMIEVVYQQETVHGSLRHPRFKRMRPDKE